MLTTERMSLRPVEADDLGVLAQWRTDPGNRKWFFNPLPVSLSGQAGWYQQLQGSRDRLLFMVELRSSGKPIGTIGLDAIDQRNQRAELGNVLIDARERGQGYGREAVNRVVEYGFADLNLRRIFLEVFAHNRAAIRLYQACGFEVEGTLRGHVFAAGEFRDVQVMSRMRVSPPQ
jgi:RimJ/RimL family protein N-acetyltransferase